MIHDDCRVGKQVHSISGWIFVALLTLHIAAAVKHQFYDRHAQFARMGLGRLPT